MKLWIQWLQAVRCLRPACTRSLTFLWMTLVLMGLCCRADNLGVTSFVRVLNLREQAYHRLLHLFHSKALNLEILTSCWVRLCLVLFRPFQVGTRLVCLADGIKAPKEGKHMLQRPPRGVTQNADSARLGQEQAESVHVPEVRQRACGRQLADPGKPHPVSRGHVCGQGTVGWQ